MKEARARKIRAARKLQLECAAEQAERAGYGPRIALEGDYLTLRWRKEQVLEALDSANMTVDQIVATHLVSRLEATKTERIKYRGEITAKFEVPDHHTQFKSVTLALQLSGVLPTGRNANSSHRPRNRQRLTGVDAGNELGLTLPDESGEDASVPPIRFQVDT